MHRINDIQYLGVYTYTIHTYIYNTIGVDPPIWKYWRKFRWRETEEFKNKFF